MARSSCQLLLISFTLAALAPPAHAFVRTVTESGAAVRWERPCMTMAVHGGQPPALTTARVMAAAEGAAGAWSAGAVSCTGFQFRMLVPDTLDGTAANDNRNSLFFLSSTWPYEQAALAITTVFAQEASGVIVDADMEINAVSFDWGDLVVEPGHTSGTVDLQNTLTHELGHVLGLDHNCFVPDEPPRRTDHTGTPVPDCHGATPEIRASSLFPFVARGDTSRRSPEPDDIAGVCAIYPAGAGMCGASGETRDGGCSTLEPSAPGGPLALLVIGASLVLLRQLRPGVSRASAGRRRGR